MANVRYFSRNTLLTHGSHTREAWVDSVPVYAIDLDDIIPVHPEPTREQRYQHAERIWSNAWGLCQELRPDANPEDAVARELVRLRAENQRMRAVVDAACVWSGESSTPSDCLGEPRCNWNQYAGAVIHDTQCNEYRSQYNLRCAVDAYRNKPAEPTHAEPPIQPQPDAATTRLIQAAVAWRVVRCERLAGCDYGDHDVACPCTATERGLSDAAMAFVDGWPTQPTPAVTPGTLTAAEREAVSFVVASARANGNRMTSHQDALVSAIDKLLAARSEPQLTPADIDRLREAYLNLVKSGPQNIDHGTYTDDAVAAFSRLRRVIGELNAAGKFGGGA